MHIHGLLFTGSCLGGLVTSKRIIVDLNTKIIIYHLESTKLIAQKTKSPKYILLITKEFSYYKTRIKKP